MEDLKTFVEWRKLGFGIKKGSRCKGVCDKGVLFSIDSTYPIDNRTARMKAIEQPRRRRY